MAEAASNPRRRARPSLRRETRRYAAAGAATVAAIYGIGYIATQPPHNATAAHTANHASTSQPAPSPQSAYREGRFTGTGSSPYGDVSVAVTVRRGRVASVEVTSTTTFFPASAVSPLIPEVIARQSAPVDAVSGATGSSQAFQVAVQQALGKARA